MKDSIPLPEDRFIKLSLDDIRTMITFLLSIQQTFSDKHGEHKYIHKMSNIMIDLFLNQLSAEDRNLMIGEKMTDSFMHNHQAALDSQREENAINWRFPEPDNDEILERLYDEAWEDYRKEHNLSDDELYKLEQNSDTGVIPKIEEEAKKDLKNYPNQQEIMMTKLEQIRNDLDNYIQEELKKSPPDRSFEVFSFEEKLCEIVDSLDEIICFDPTPDGDSPYSDAEYIITPQERDRKALESKRESHGRDHNIPFNW